MTTIVIDGIFFQVNEWSGIAKYWRNLLDDIDRSLDQGSKHDFRVFLLVRGESRVLRDRQYKHIHKLPISFFDYRCALSEFEQLGNLCRDLGATAFISSYYTLAFGVPNVGMAYDFIPEHLNVIHTDHSWVAKALYMKSLSCTLAISESTARDAPLFYPGLDSSRESVFYPPIEDDEFRAISRSEVGAFRSLYGLQYPYVAIVGNRTNYKNVNILASALKCRDSNQHPLPLGIVMTSGEEISRDEINLYSRNFTFGVRRLSLTPANLTCLLNGAEMLFYPSLLEGFGYPILEAMAQGCPVITTGSTSIPEILRYAESDEYKIISGYDGNEALEAIISLMHSRRRVSASTITRLKEVFGRNEAPRFLKRIEELAQTARPPVDDYLSACRTLDGLLA